MIREDVGAGPAVYSYDALNRPTVAEYDDGAVETFEWDARSELAKAVGLDCEIHITREPIGEIVDEIVSAAGESTRVHNEWSVDGKRQLLSSSLGDVVLRYERDAMGYTARLWLNHKDYIEFQRNGLGAAIRVRLPGGGAFENEYDPLTRLACRRVLGPEARARVPGEPEYLGPDGRGSFAKIYAWSARSQLLHTEGGASGSSAYAYDADGRLTERRSGAGQRELFAYDANSNVFEPDAERVYDAANKLRCRGNDTYEYDDAGRRVEKRATADGVERVWTYEWNGQGQLASVSCPDGTLVTFSYDPFSRRLTKRVRSPDERSAVTRYVWDERRLFQQRRDSFDADGQAFRSELTTYAYEDRHWHSPVAEQRIVREGDVLRDEGWVFHCASVIGTAEEVLAGDGSIVGSLRMSAYGTASAAGRSTELRFPGQIHDEETELSYNLHRYFDPKTGQYINPDPWGVEGGLNLYAYCVNPVTYFDPYGLHGLFFEVTDKDNNAVGPDQGQPSGPGNWSPLQSGQNGAPFKEAKYGQLGTGDTEAKALDLLDKNDEAKKAVKGGGTAKMSGQFPPCKSCHRKMKNWMAGKDNKGKIDYHYPTNQKITYNGGGSSKPPVETEGKAAGNLVNAYNSDKVTKLPEPVPVMNKDGTQKMKNGEPVFKTKESSASKEYQAQKEAAKDNPGAVQWPDAATKKQHEDAPSLDS
jgi:RHS repeat-associated protein